MRRFCWRERSEKLNWRLLGALDVSDAVRRGDPAVLEPYALHVTFARLPTTSREPATRDAWFLVRILQLSMEYLLFMRARDGDVLESLSQELRQVETERDGLVLRSQRWKARARSGDKQVEKLHQVLQNIAKLLQIHGASPSAVATIEALLTELISERRAKQKIRALMEEEKDGDDRDEMEEVVRPAVQEARVCGFCGKLFSSAEYLEKHLVRRHGGESIEVETPVKHKMRRDVGDEVEDKENRVKNDESAASEAAMQKMVQQVERALHGHEEKLRLLAEEEAQKVKKLYERLHTETKLAEEGKSTRLRSELGYEESQRQLDEVCLQKQKAEDELADLKQQIQFLTLKKKMMGTAANAVLPSSLPYKSDDALVAAEAEIKDLQQTLETVNAELTASREELAKVQALHLSALRKKKELADKLAVSRGVSAVVQQEHSSQTELPTMINQTVQTDEQSNFRQVEGKMLTESCTPIRENVGTDPLILSYEDVGIQTVDILQPLSVDAVQMDIIDNLVPALTRAASPVEPEPISQESVTVEASEVAEDAAPPKPTVPKDDERTPDYIHQIHSQDLLDIIVERAQRAASKAANNSPVSKNYSSISRHKYVRSRFQHGEDVVKERVASCLAQLEQFTRRFGVPAKSAWLSEANVLIVQQALHGHLEVLPTEVLAKMVDCENTVNVIIEKEWAPMEKSRQQALERFKMETRAKSEISQGLVRQAMAAFGNSMKAEQPSVSSENVVATNSGRSASKEEMPAEGKLNEGKAQDSSTDSKNDSVMTPARRYSAKNQLTVVVREETTAEGTAYLADDFEKRKIVSPTGSDDFAIAVPAPEEKANPPEVREAVDSIVESLHRDDETSNLEDNFTEPFSITNDASSSQSRHDIPTAASSPLGDPPVAAITSSVDTELPEITEIRLPHEASTNQTRSIRVDAATNDISRSSWKTDSLARSHSGDPEPSANEDQQVVPAQEIIEDNRRIEWQDEGSQWHIPRVGSSSDLGTRILVSPELSCTRSDPYEATSLFQSIDSLQPDRLSEASEFAVIDPGTGLDHTQSIVASSEMSFNTSIPSLGESESLGASTSTVVMGVVDAIGRSGQAEDFEDSASSLGPAPAATTLDVQNDSVMTFDDSDIEELVLT